MIIFLSKNSLTYISSESRNFKRICPEVTTGLYFCARVQLLSWAIVHYNLEYNMTRIVRKPDFCICENKGADQLHGNREADQRLCFRYTDSIFPLLLISEISSFYLFSVLIQAGLCQTCSETTLLVFPRGGSYIWSIIKDNKNKMTLQR